MSAVIQRDAIQELMMSAVEMCLRDGVAPHDAAAKVLPDLTVVGVEDVLSMCRMFLTHNVAKKVAQLRREPPSEEPDRSGEAFRALARRVADVADVLSRVAYRDFDGQQRPLLTLSGDAHSNLAEKATATSVKAREKAAFHEAALYAMRKSKVERIADLPPDEIEVLREAAEVIWG